MKILVLNYEFPPVGGGGGRVSEDLCEVLSARGHEIQVLTAQVGGLSREEIRDSYRILRVPTGRRSYFRASFLVMLAYIISGFIPAVRLIRKWQPDVIHAHFAVPTGALAYMLALLTGLPYVLTIHLGDVPGGVPNKTDRWFRWVYSATHRIYRKASAVVAVSEHTRALALAHYSVDIRVIPNGVDLAQFEPVEVHLNNPREIIFVARFVEQKNPIGLVQTLAELESQNWRCNMVGDGILANAIRAEIKTHQLEDRIHMHGWSNPERVVELMRGSDIIFMPSRSEGLPVVGVQALALGLAFVAGRVGGFPDLVEEGKNGDLFDPDDLVGMRAALDALLQDEETLRSYREYSLKVVPRFDLQLIGDEYEEVFESAVSS